MRLKIYVPAHTGRPREQIKRGSSIVGVRDLELIKVHFEGNLYGAVNLHKYVERLRSAAGRYVARYPTGAVMWTDESTLVEVGEYETNSWGIAEISNPTALAAWLDPEPLPVAPIVVK